MFCETRKLLQNHKFLQLDMNGFHRYAITRQRFSPFLRSPLLYLKVCQEPPFGMPSTIGADRSWTFFLHVKCLKNILIGLHVGDLKGLAASRVHQCMCWTG